MDAVTIDGRWPEDPYAVPLDQINMADPAHYRDNTAFAYFRRLRAEDPVHWNGNHSHPFWSVTRYNDIMAVDSNHKVFSSGVAGTVIEEDFLDGTRVPGGVELLSFITMDQPRHDEHRKAVSPAVAPQNLKRLEGLIRQRTQNVLDELPIGEEFDWVPRVAVNLTTQMLATLFDWPFERREELTYWSNAGTGFPGDGLIESWEHRNEVLKQMVSGLRTIWDERAARADPDAPDLLSMLTRAPQTADLSEAEFAGTLFLLIVGGNDTTRNSMSGGAKALHDFPQEWEKLKANPALLDSMVPETIRYQSPVIYQRRTALEDTELGGKQIRKGDRVAMWYMSGNRDDAVIERPDEFIIDRPRARQHLSFGFGIHRCVGNRLAEMQLRVLWEEVLKRFDRVEVVGEAKYLYNPILRGINSLPVKLHAKGS